MNDGFVEIACPVCGGLDFSTIVEITPDEFLSDSRKKYYNLEVLNITMDTSFYIKKCRYCSFVMLNPRFGDDLYGVVYNEAKVGQYDKNDWMFAAGDLQRLYNTHSKYDAAINLLESIIHLKDRFEKVKNEGKKPIRLLDYGCGMGHILDLCKVFDIEAKGVEVDDKRLSYCDARGLDVCRPEELSADEN